MKIGFTCMWAFLTTQRFLRLFRLWQNIIFMKDGMEGKEEEEKNQHRARFEP